MRLFKWIKIYILIRIMKLNTINSTYFLSFKYIINNCVNWTDRKSGGVCKKKKTRKSTTTMTKHEKGVLFLYFFFFLVFFVHCVSSAINLNWLYAAHTTNIDRTLTESVNLYFLFEKKNYLFLVFHRFTSRTANYKKNKKKIPK